MPMKTTDKDIALLTQYLISLYGKDTAKKLLIDNKNNLFGYHGLTYALGKRSLAFFCLYFLQDIYTGDGKAPLAPIHYEMWQEVQDMILNKTHDKQDYILPRGLGKSTIITLAVSIWASVYKLKKYTVIASAIGDTAEGFIKNIKMAVDGNKYIESAFGKMYDPRSCVSNSEKIEFTNKTMIQSVSAASSLRGKAYNNTRIELALLDDYQKADEIMTDEQRERKWKRFSDDINFAMQKDNSTIIALGTLQCKDDFYDRLKHSNVWKTKQEKGVLVDDVRELFSNGLWSEFKAILTDNKNEFRLDDAKEFYYQHESKMQFPMLWKEYWNCLDIALLYFENPASFLQEFQGNIDNIGERRFHTIITESAEEIEQHNFTNTILSVDPAGTKRANGTHDFYAFCVLSKSDAQIMYARKSIIKDFEYDDYLKLVMDLLKQYPDISHLDIEKNVYSGADVIQLSILIADDPQLKNRKIEIINKNRTQNKDNRINAVIPDVNMGRVIFNEADTEALEQLRSFCGCKFTPHDDYPDCLTSAIENMREIKDVSKIKVLPLSFLGL